MVHLLHRLYGVDAPAPRQSGDVSNNNGRAVSGAQSVNRVAAVLDGLLVAGRQMALKALMS